MALTGTVTATDLAGLNQLTVLSIASNQIKQVDADLLQDLSALVKLDLSGNNLTSIPKELFTKDQTARFVVAVSLHKQRKCLG